MTIMRVIPGTKGCYAATENGDIFSTRNNILLKTFRCKNGYLYVNFSVNGVLTRGNVHRFVAAAFHGRCPRGKQVAHLNGKRDDNRPNNLRYVTPTQNNCHKIAHGTIAWGDRTSLAKLTSAQVIEIRKSCVHGARREGLTTADFARRFGVSTSTVCRALRGDTWLYLQSANERAAHI